MDRIIIEWRSLLRRIAHAPELDWSRWKQLHEPRPLHPARNRIPDADRVAAFGIPSDPAS